MTTGVHLVIAACCIVLGMGVLAYREARGDGLSEIAVLAWVLQALAVIMIGSLAFSGLLDFLGRFIRVEWR